MNISQKQQSVFLAGIATIAVVVLQIVLWMIIAPLVYVLGQQAVLDNSYVAAGLWFVVTFISVAAIAGLFLKYRRQNFDTTVFLRAVFVLYSVLILLLELVSVTDFSEEFGRVNQILFHIAAIILVYLATQTARYMAKTARQ